MATESDQQEEAPDPHEIFLRLWMQHEPELRAFVRSCCPKAQEVDDVMQEVSVAALRKFSTLENQEIVAALRKKHPDYDSNPTLKYKKADLLKGAPDPRDYGGSDPINAVAALYSPYQRYHSYLKHYAELPHSDRGAYLKLSRGVQRFDVRPDPKNISPGTLPSG